MKHYKFYTIFTASKYPKLYKLIVDFIYLFFYLKKGCKIQNQILVMTSITLVNYEPENICKVLSSQLIMTRNMYKKKQKKQRNKRLRYFSPKPLDYWSFQPPALAPKPSDLMPN